MMRMLLLPPLSLIAACQPQMEAVVVEQPMSETREVVVPTAARQAFEELAADCGMEFHLPDGFLFEAGSEAHGLDHEATLIDEAGLIEVRLSLRNLEDAEVAYEDPHSSTPSPEHIYPLMFLAIVQAISQNPEAPSLTFGEAALGEYEADWGQASVLKPDSRYSELHSSLLLIALHRRSASDAYMAFLYDDYELAKERIAAAKSCLKYLP